MTELDPFSKSNIDELKAFARKLSVLYSIIQQIVLYRSIWPGYKFIMIIDIQDDDSIECNKAIEELGWENVFFWRGMRDLPDCIREQESLWWIEPKATSGDFPQWLADENKGFILYDGDNTLNEKINLDTKGSVTANDKKVTPIETPMGTTWKKLFFTVRNYEITEIKHLGGTVNKKQFEIGLKEIGNRPSKQLFLFLLLALNNGELKPQAGTEGIKPTVSRLRKTLQSVFPGISGDPMPYDYKSGKWETAFNLKSDVETLLETMPDAAREMILPYLQKK